MRLALRTPTLKSLLLWGMVGLCMQGISCFFGGQDAQGQNLISNWSIEPIEGQAPPCAFLSVDAELTALAAGYSMPTLGTPDIFSEMAEQGCFASLNVGNPMHPGAVSPRSGKQLAGIIAHTASPGQESYREYLGVDFSEALVVGEQYYLEFFFQLSQRSEYMIPQLGAALVNMLAQELTTGNLALTPILNVNGAVNPGGWVKASMTFTATSALKGLILGRFSNSGDAQLSGGRIGVRPVAYYYFDDITLQKASQVTFRGDLKVCEGSLATIEAVSPFATKWLGLTTNGWQLLQTSRFATLDPKALTAFAVVTGADTTIVPLEVSASLPGKIQSFQSICEGKAVLLAPLAQHYLWSTGDTTRSLEVYAPANYSVKLTSGACFRVDTVSVDYPEALPEDFLPLIGQLENGSISLSAPEGRYTYLWSNGETSRTVETSQTGLYACQVSNGCFTLTDSIKVVSSLPNQASFIFTSLSGPLQLPLPDFDDIELRIFNNLGQQLYSDLTYANTWTSETLPNGMYYYKAISPSTQTQLVGRIQVVR